MLVSKAFELIATTAVRANEVDAEAIDADLFGIERNFLTTANAEPVHVGLL